MSTPSSNLDATGATGSIAVTTDPECTWTASTTASWISSLSPVSGQGTGRVEFRVPANPSPSMRQGEVTINGSNAIVRQEGSPCRFQINPATEIVERTEGRRRFPLRPKRDVPWSASGGDPWVTVVSGDRGNGNGTVTLRVLANDGATERTAVLTIAGQPFAMTQSARLASTLCLYTIAPARVVVGPTADAGPPVSVETTDACTWRPTTDTPWITITSAPESRGPGRVTYTVSANTGGARSGTILIGGQTFEIDQDAATACAFVVSPTSLNVGASGGSGGALNVSTTSSCSWTSLSNAPWITVTSGSTRTGSGTVSINVAPNTGPARSGSVTVAGKTVSVEQGGAASACSYSLSPVAQSATAGGGAGTPIQVTTAAGCTWTATSNVPWLTIGAGASGSGSGSMTFVVAANTGGVRAGSLTVAGQTATVTQSGAPPSPLCLYEVSPAHDSIGAAGGTGTTIVVSSPTGCSWNASTDAPWISIVSGAVGSANGSVVYVASTNLGARRSGTIIAADRSVVIDQAAAPCDYSIAPTTQNIGGSGGAGTPVNVTTRSDCTWTASSDASWLSITSGASGSGNGSVQFTAAANTGAARSGDLVIAGHRASVAQAAAPPPCTYTIAPGSATIGATGGAGTAITVTTAAGCTWTATSAASWLTITSGASGTGGGTVAYSAAANTGAQRTGDLTVAGRTFTVTQSAAPPACTYSIAPGSTTIAASGGAGAPVTVTTAAGCMWTAASNAPWLTITSGASGTGGGTVAYSAAANAGAQRSGTLTIAGQTFTVTQSQPCSYTINPTSQTATAGGGAGTTVVVTTSTGCAWTATSNAAWLTITSGASGNGNGNVGFTIAANTGAQRTGTLTVAGQTYTVTQSAPAPTCSYSIRPLQSVVRGQRRQRHDDPCDHHGWLFVDGGEQRLLDFDQIGRERYRQRVGRVQGRQEPPDRSTRGHADDRRPDLHCYAGWRRAMRAAAAAALLFAIAPRTASAQSISDVLSFLVTNRSIPTDDFVRDEAAAAATRDTISGLLLLELATLPIARPPAASRIA